MQTLKAEVAAKKADLDHFRDRLPGRMLNFDHSQDIELTFTSNAIEGNTLSAAETTLVIEHGITIGGKPLKDHLEAIDHFDALGYVRQMAKQSSPLSELEIRNLHRLVLLRSSPEIAGRYADQGRFVVTDAGRFAFPAPVHVPALMGELADWLRGTPATPAVAFTAHRRLVDIHPFNDGNGRTARLLMNLLLIRGGHPPVAIRPVDRPAYIAALQTPSNSDAFDRLLYQRLDATLDEYLVAYREALPGP